MSLGCRSDVFSDVVDWKTRFSFRCRPEGIFRIFFRPDSGPPTLYEYVYMQRENQGPLNGGVSNGGGGGFPIWTCPFLSFLGLSRFFRDLPDLLGDGPGIFPICPFPLSRPVKSTYEEQSRNGPRHNLDLSRKSGKHPGLETPRLSFSQDSGPPPVRMLLHAARKGKFIRTRNTYALHYINCYFRMIFGCGPDVAQTSFRMW